MIHFTDHGGRKLSHVHLQLIFWGSTWEANPGPSTSAKDIQMAMTRVMESDYLAPLFQYNVGSGHIAPPVIITSSDPPSLFNTTDVEIFLYGLLDANFVPGPDQNKDTLYLVMMPPGTLSYHVEFGIKTPDMTGGVHASSIYPRPDLSKPLPPDNLFYGWVLASGHSGPGELGEVTRVISHELVEACTDPVAETGVVGDPGACVLGYPGVCEIADACGLTVGPIDGVTVSGYWSQLDGQCILPKTIIPPLWSSVMHWVESHQSDPGWLVTLWQAIQGGDPSPELSDLVTLGALAALTGTLRSDWYTGVSVQLRDLVLPALQTQINRLQKTSQRQVTEQFFLSASMLSAFETHIQEIACRLRATGRLTANTEQVVDAQQEVPASGQRGQSSTHSHQQPKRGFRVTLAALSVLTGAMISELGNLLVPWLLHH